MTDPSIIHRPSPNWNERPNTIDIDILVLHYTGMDSAAASLTRLTEPESKVSAHYLIDEDGTIYQMVDERNRAWHAGISYWSGLTDINSSSIGIELQNPGHEFGYRPFPNAQIEALIPLCKQILTRHPIPPERVLGHSDVAPARKQDPGELFDWKRLAEAGIGSVPQSGGDDSHMTDDEARNCLTAIGYDPDLAFDLVLTAFQRHYRQSDVSGTLDKGTAGLLRSMVG